MHMKQNVPGNERVKDNYPILSKLPVRLSTKIISIRLHSNRRKLTKNSLDLIWKAYQIVEHIGIPKKQEDIIFLRKVMKTYDKCISDLNDYFEYIRDYIKEE